MRRVLEHALPPQDTPLLTVAIMVKHVHSSMKFVTLIEQCDEHKHYHIPLRWHLIPTLSLPLHECTLVLLHSERLASSPLQSSLSRNIGPLITPANSVASATSTSSGMRTKNNHFMAVAIACHHTAIEEQALYTAVYTFINTKLMKSNVTVTHVHYEHTKKH